MPTTSGATAITAVRRRAGDVNATQRLTDDQVDLAIVSAVERYSKDRPREAVVDLTGNGTSFYSLALLTGFVLDWSIVRRIEYPAGPVATVGTPTFLSPGKDWSIHRTASVDYLRLTFATPSTAETVRVWYTVPRTWTEASTTVLTPDQNAVLALATSYALDVLANMSSDNLDTLIPTDTVDYASIQERFRNQAKAWAARYDAHMGAGSGGNDSGGGGAADAAAMPRAAAIRRNFDPDGLNPFLTRRGRT